MSMVEQGLGISILPLLILRRIPYDVVVKSLDRPAYRTIGIVMKNQDTASASVKKFMEYIDLREPDRRPTDRWPAVDAGLNHIPGSPAEDR